MQSRNPREVIVEIETERTYEDAEPEPQPVAEEMNECIPSEIPLEPRELAAWSFPSVSLRTIFIT